MITLTSEHSIIFFIKTLEINLSTVYQSFSVRIALQSQVKILSICITYLYSKYELPNAYLILLTEYKQTIELKLHMPAKIFLKAFNTIIIII